MSSKVYAAGKAFFPLPGKSKEQAWKELTGMFNQDAEDAKSYIPGHFPLECISRHRPNDISVGDVFKYTASHGSEIYVRIVECTPYESFTYDEQWMPMSGEHIDRAYKDDSRDRMEFILRSHPEGTLVEIRRREKGKIEWLDRMIYDSAEWAAGRLQFILTGGHWEKGEVTRGDITIKRDDSYRIDF